MSHPSEPTAGTVNVNEPSAAARRFDWRLAVVIGLALISIPIWRWGEQRVKVRPPQTSRMAVAVAKVTREDLGQELVFDAELRPYQEIDMHAKVAGYLEKITVDVGDRVEAGQLLATIEIPELEEDI